MIAAEAVPGTKTVTEHLRKLVTFVEELPVELGLPVQHPVYRVAVAAVVTNPWSGQGYVSQLQTGARDLASFLGNTLGKTLLSHFGQPAGAQAVGKAVIVGEDGELEHGAALIHTPYFADLVRAWLQGTAVIPSAEHRAGPGASVVVPLGHKASFATRSHYQGMEVRVGDAPRPDELIVVAAASAGPRPNARVGDRTTDPPLDVALLMDLGGQ